MSKTILIAGASGSLGREVVAACRRRGHKVIAMVRDPKAKVDCDELRVANALQADTLKNICQGVDVLFSCVGASVSLSLGKGWRSYTAVDTPANLNLLAAAKAANVGRFVYVSFHGARQMMHLNYAIAHEKVVAAIIESKLPYGIMRPVGFFSALAELQDLANRGVIPEIGDGTTKTNPIHDADLAEACLEVIEDDNPSIERSIGGPDILTRHQINHLAFAGLNKKTRVLHLPPWLAKTNGYLSRPFHPRISHAISFFATISIRDSIAPCFGTHTLQAFYEERGRSFQPK
jgi:uncharacterized protein YbjT (DUF2867 family)